ncbi:hypothetical protein MMC11_006277 [Xylographa trunciseda]|nr:hypothetical protein [Xylographa trunciseda]
MSEGAKRDLSSDTSKRLVEVLQRAFSVHSYVPSSLYTSSSLVGQLGHVEDESANEGSEYLTIGLGSCGTVFQILGTDFAVKKGKDVKAMCNDFLLTNRVYNAMADTRELLQGEFSNRTLPKIPQCVEFLLPDSKDYWEDALYKFPRSHREIGAAFQVDLIRPLPKITREALINLYFDDGEEVKQVARTGEENEHCLVRTYLGEREAPDQYSAGYDSLRNFPLRLNMIEDLGLDKFALAIEMAVALAVIHWPAQVDAMDVEFVLGSASQPGSDRRRAYAKAPGPSDFSSPHEVSHLHRLNFKTRPIHMWVLDFDKATSTALTPNDVDKKLVPAFLGNDPYYPRPEVDEALWKNFSKTYLTASRIILRNRQESASVMSLPKLFLDKVAEMIKKHEDWDPEEQIVFGR